MSKGKEIKVQWERVKKKEKKNEIQSRKSHYWGQCEHAMTPSKSNLRKWAVLAAPQLE